jgi:hypothetical protein
MESKRYLVLPNGVVENVHLLNGLVRVAKHGFTSPISFVFCTYFIGRACVEVYGTAVRDDTPVMSALLVF